MDASQYWAIVESQQTDLTRYSIKVARNTGCAWLEAEDILHDALIACATAVPRNYRSHYYVEDKLSDKFEIPEGCTGPMVEYTRTTAYFYLMKAATKRIKQQQRSADQIKEQGGSESEVDEDLSLDVKDLRSFTRQEIDGALAELTDWESWLVRKRYFDGEPTANLASITRFGHSTIKKDLRKSLARLRKFLRYANEQNIKG